MWQWILRTLDRKIPEHLRDSPNTRRRALLAVGIAYASALGGMVVMAVVIGFMHAQSARELAVRNLVIAILLLLMAIPALRRFGLVWVAHWLSAILALGLVYAVYFGGLFSPFVTVFPLVPVLATIVGGRKPGIFWAGASIAALGVIWLLGGAEREQVMANLGTFSSPSLVMGLLVSITVALATMFVAFSESTNRDLLVRLSATNQLLVGERAKAESLLANVLPGAIVERLHAGATAIADYHTHATVLFADIVGFTAMAAQVPASEVVAFLDRVFTCFDALADKHGLEKIKTIGDAYMVAGGLSSARGDQTEAVAAMALEMQTVIAEFRRPDGMPVVLRVGIHTGPLVAGVIGTRRLLYDLWGDTVNLASRMESHGDPGRIQVSTTTREALAGSYEFSSPREIEIKGKGLATTYFLLRPRA